MTSPFFFLSLLGYGYCPREDSSPKEEKKCQDMGVRGRSVYVEDSHSPGRYGNSFSQRDNSLSTYLSIRLLAIAPMSPGSGLAVGGILRSIG